MTAEELSSEDLSKLGRFELVHELGHGGMASVYLARTKGPAGFQKWVAIKRVHPHLAKDERFVNMFLDEARIAAAVQHPNVAQVFELGEEDGDYFLAMEYLHGEHLGALSVAAIKEDSEMRYALAAKIVADAARGLHHAHEIVDGEGRPLNLVHRDVSPQNIFITYDGQIKVTDFGIAKARGRITHTHTGNIKGKAAYMAPEQAMGSEIDRRTDIFALGVVLWEITVGRRLFKAQTQAQTLMRVMKGDPTRPSELREDYPEALEAIVMQALSFEPEERQSTAAAFADSLEAFMATQTTPGTSGELGALMTRLFPDRHAARNALLREDVTSIEVRKSSRPPRSAPQSLSLDVTQSEVMIRSRSLDVTEGARRGYSNWRRFRWVAVGVALSTLVGLLIWKVAVSIQEPDEPKSEPAQTVTTPKFQRVVVESTPPGANVTLGKRNLGNTPLTVNDLPKGSHTLTLSLAGYSEQTRHFELREGATLQLSYELRPTTKAVPKETKKVRRVTKMSSAQRGSGKLTLISLPYSTLRVNGGTRKTTPVTVETKAGKVTVTYQVRGQGPVRTKSVSLQDGESKKIRLNTQ